MASLGEKLKEARLKQGLSLNEIADKTRIQTHFLEAIEHDKLEKIPGDFFRKSFVRQYASTLGLDPDEFETTTEIQFGSFGAGSTALQESLPLPEQPDLPPLPSFGNQGTFAFRQVFLSVGLLVGVIAVCAVAYMIWEDFQTRERNASTAAQVSQPAESPIAPAAQAEPVSTEAPTGTADASGASLTTTPPAAEAAPPAEPGVTAANPTAPATPTATPSGAAAPSEAATAVATPPPPAAASPATVLGSGNREIRLSANTLTWVRVRDGEKTVYVGTIDAGQSRVIRVGETAQILTGNAGGLSVTWQGSDVGKIGPVGQVRTVTLTPEGVSIQAPAPKTPPEGRGATGSPGVER